MLLIGIGSILAAIIGPVSAVLITLGWERHRKRRDQKETVLQTLLVTRDRAGDPSYSWAINSIRMHFSQSPRVLKAYSDYLDAVRLRPSAENETQHVAHVYRLQGLLISEILQDLDYKGLTSEQIEGYTAQGLVEREQALFRALEALPNIAISAARSAELSALLVRKAYEGQRATPELAAQIESKSE